MKKKFMTVHAGALAGVMAAGCLLGGMLARYDMRRENVIRTEIPEWDIKMDEDRTNLIAADLGKTVNQELNQDSIISKEILPGIFGAFRIKLDASGSTDDVGYIINIAENSNNETALPDYVHFKIDDGADVVNYKAGENIKGVIERGSDSSSMIKYITVTWEWLFCEADDKKEILNLYENTVWNFDITVTSRPKKERGCRTSDKLSLVGQPVV